MKLGECSHNSYWKVAYDGTCMACRAEQAEARVQALEQEVEKHKAAVEIIQSSRDILLDTFCLWIAPVLQARVQALEQQVRIEREIAEHNLADTHEAEKRVSDLQHQLAKAEARVQALEQQLETQRIEKSYEEERAGWEGLKQYQKLDQKCKALEQEQATLKAYVAQVEHWKAEAMWAASFIVSLFKAAWEADQSSTYQRAQAILKEAEI